MQLILYVAMHQRYVLYTRWTWIRFVLDDDRTIFQIDVFIEIHGYTFGGHGLITFRIIILGIYSRHWQES